MVNASRNPDKIVLVLITQNLKSKSFNCFLIGTYSTYCITTYIISEFAEADSFFCFTNLMAEIRDNFIKTLDESQCGIGV